jgi:NADH-quinone oxidoreductase subunit J
MLDAFLFYFFSALTVGGAVLLITRRNVIVSGVWLIVSLLGVAGLFLLQGAEFLFVAQLVVYIGGVVLLFLVALMLISLESTAQLKQFRRSWPLIAAVGAGLGAELIILLMRSHLSQPGTYGLPARPNTESIADMLFSRYLVAFELASVILLVAIVGAVIMAQQGGKENSA